MSSKKSLITWKSSNYFWNTCKELIQKIYIQSSLLEVFLKNTVSEFLFQSNCNFAKRETSAQLFSCEFCEFSGRLLLSIAIIRKEHFNMWEEQELWYYDHLSPHFNDFSLKWIITFQFIKHHVRIKLSHLNIYQIKKWSW